MPKTPSEREKSLKELEELEFHARGVFACITPERHRKRWEQKVSKLNQEIAEAETSEEKERLEQKLIELNQAEKKKAKRLAEFHSLNDR